jgi:hypothetical protein
MEFLKETRFIERLQFFNGQRLFASDLQGLEAFNREMRWLHNKSLHQPGIGNGFAVSGKKGDREVQIGAGYAIDADGREIVLTEGRVEPVPPVAGEAEAVPALYYLTLSYPDDADLEESEIREGICNTRGVIRLKEEPVFCWVRLGEDGQPKDPALKQEILAGRRLVLAQAEVLNCQLNKDLSIAQRLSARPAKQPYVCCGTADAQWDPLYLAPLDFANLSASEQGQQFLQAFNVQIRFFPIIAPVGLQMTIDTSDCGFLTTPCYSARIAGPRVKQITDEILEELKDVEGAPERGRQKKAATRKRQLSFIVDGLVQIVDSKPDRFTINVLLIGQVLLPTGAEVDTDVTIGISHFINRGQPPAKGAEKRAVAPEKVERLVEKIIEVFFSDWNVEWMGVEG